MKFGLKRTLALAALMTGAAGVAHATEGWYVRGDVGQSIDASLEGNLDDESATLDLDNGFVGAVGAGYSWDSGFRVEAELSYRKNQFGFNFNESDFSGETIAWGLLANIFYYFNRGGNF